ncbi:hypothetical protein AGMMS4957_14930 [Bacteroidia bacterium]|nr:hypothetical protein AGMMS4957_14930 [Bacteroidia bacterium]
MPIQFSAGISLLRVGVAPGASAETLWEIPDTIGVFMQNVTQGTEYVVNSPYRVAAAGALGSFISAGTPNYFPLSNDDFSFKAYYPYKNDATITSITTPIQIDVSNQTQSATNRIDVLYAANDNGGSYFHNFDSPPIPLTFSHIMSKLVVNVTRGTGVTGALTATSVKLKSMVAKGDVDLFNGTIAAVSGSETIIQARQVTTGTPRQYEAILVPHTFPPAGGAETDSIVITAGAKVYAISLLRAFSTATPAPVIAFESGKKYTLNAELTVGVGTSADYVIGATTSPWGSVSGLKPAEDCGSSPQ